MLLFSQLDPDDEEEEAGQLLLFDELLLDEL